MAWKELFVVDQRQDFVMRAMHEPGSFRELCQEYGISAKTGYKWKSRFMEQGLGGMHDRSRRPASTPGLGEDVVCELVRLRQAHPTWGPRKLQVLYERIHGSADVPSESSIKRVLDRAGLVVHRRRRRSADGGRLQSGMVAQGPNDLWTVDFKGWWYTPHRQVCQPLTVRDAFSRFVLGIAVPPDGGTKAVRGEFERLFERYGLPGAIRSDNGRPFAASTAPLGLSRLSAWWVALGISLDRIDPGHPEQNGAHERMHRDIAREVERRVDGDLRTHAAALELWRQEYNQQRPHEALEMRTPAEFYTKSTRRYTGTPDHLEYPPGYLARQVNSSGMVRVYSQQIWLTSALAGWNVGLKPVGDGQFTVYFASLCLGQIDVATESFRTYRPGQEPQQ
jgi:putative transposase